MSARCLRCGFENPPEEVPEFAPNQHVVITRDNVAHAIEKGHGDLATTACGQSALWLRGALEHEWALTKDTRHQAWPSWPCQTCVARVSSHITEETE